MKMQLPAHDIEKEGKVIYSTYPGLFLLFPRVEAPAELQFPAQQLESGTCTLPRLLWWNISMWKLISAAA